MNEDYVTRGQAEILHDIGFDWLCFASYGDGGSFKIHPINRNWNNESYGFISAPTLAQAAKWLRDTYGLHICVRFDKNNSAFSADVVSVLPHVDVDFEVVDYYDADEALSAGIDKALDYIIDQWARE